jgi:hypothetical protein
MLVVFALTIQSPLLHVKKCKSSSRMLYWTAGKLDMNFGNKVNVSIWCVLTYIEDSYRVMCVYLCVYVCVLLTWGVWDRIMCE